MWVEHLGKVRVVFVAEEDDENPVRDLIDQALARGECVGPDGKLSRWKTTGHSAGVLNESEQAFGARITSSPGRESRA